MNYHSINDLVELCHTLGVFKWHDLGVKYELEDIMPPTKEEIQRADDILHTGDYKGYLEK